MIETTNKGEMSATVQAQAQWFTGLLVTMAVLLALLTAATIARPSLAKPYLMDEMEFPSVAQAIASTGQPVYYRSELYPTNVGLWHPPLYVVWYAGWIKLFGDSTVSGRSFGLFNIGVALAATALFAWRRWPTLNDSDAHPIRLAVALLCGLLVAATSPLLIQGATLPDIDTQVLPLTLTVFMLVMFELRRRGVSERRYWIAFVIGCTVQLYAKLPALLLIVPTFAVFELVRGLERLPVMRARRRHAGRPVSKQTYSLPIIVTNLNAYRAIAGALLAVAGSACALLLLIVSWYVLAQLWGVNYSLPFIYLTQSSNNPANYAGSGGLIATTLASAPEHFNYVLQWIGLPALCFVVLLIVREFRVPVAGLLSRPERLALYTFFLVLLGIYIVLRPAPFAFPKYYPPLIPVLSLLAVDVLTTVQRPPLRWTPLVLFGALIATYLLYIALNQRTTEVDFILLFYNTWPKIDLVHHWMTFPLLIALVVAGIGAAPLRAQPVGILAVAALAVALGWQFDISSLQARASYSTTYYYGEESIEQVADYLRASLPEDVVLIAPKDIGYMLQDHWRYYELQADPRPLIDQPNVQYLVMREKDYYGNTIRETPEIASAIAAAFEPEATIGAFVVMKKPISQ